MTEIEMNEHAAKSGLQKFQAIARENSRLHYRPTSVYRIQLNREFTFRDATSILPYLHELGAEAVYLSPILEAVPGSMHGYNVTDPNRLNPELGTGQDFDAFCAALKQLGMGAILDVVPNHMGIASNTNRWWLDVLENGEASRFSPFFDIDWDPVKKDLKDKVLLPVLGQQYGVALENQDIRLEFMDGAFLATIYGERRFPIAPDTYPHILQHGLDDLVRRLGEENRDLLELLSIISAFGNLPSRAERDPLKVAERHREKEIDKSRLHALASRSPEISGFIQSRVELFNGRKGDPKSFDLLDQLLNLQSYRLAYWKAASEEINYRRFFDVNELAAIRVEHGEVFDQYHQLVFRLLHEGKIQGLRIDHPDGLYDPVSYFQNLQKKYLEMSVRSQALAGRESLPAGEEAMLQEVVNSEPMSLAQPLYVVVEKILDRKEDLPEDWCVHGTVGYDFLNALTGVFVDRKNEHQFTDIYHRFTRERMDFEQLLYDKKKFFAAFYMASELNTLAHRLDSISEKIRRYRDFTLSNLTTAIREVIACFPVYRTYIRPDDSSVSERDEKYIHIAIEKAKQKHPALSRSLFDFLRQVLLGKFEDAFEEEERKQFREFVLRFQQLTAPIMAKGLEDTVFYIYSRLLSLNDVGGDPQHFGYSSGEFHRQNQERRQKWPYSIISTSTHDTKRSEDVRMRMNVLSEIPAEWQDRVDRWARINKKHKTLMGGRFVPTRNTEYFIYQTLVGIWPNEPVTNEDAPALQERLWNYFLKALREAKMLTHWLNPNEEYESAVRRFVGRILSQESGNPFLEDFVGFQQKVADFGMLNSLSALVLKIGSPGVTDHYQGTGSWDFSLVDPDNRRPVDFELRRKQLEQVSQLAHSTRSLPEVARTLLDTKEDGRIKRYLLWKSLSFRRLHPSLFLEGDYIPLAIEGRREHNIVAFARRMEDRILVVACGRFFAQLHPSEKGVASPVNVWEDTVIVLPKGWSAPPGLKDLFTGQDVELRDHAKGVCLRASEVFQTLTVSMLTNINPG